MALLKANTGIGITNPSSALHVIGDGLFVGVVSATTLYGNLGGGVQGSVPYQSGISSTTFLSPGLVGQVLVTGGPGQNPYWTSASALSGSFTGVTIRDEGTVVGSAASVSSLNFVGSNIVATASGIGATITIADNLVGTALSISGISTLGTVKISSGIITATSGVVTYYGDGSGLSRISAVSAGIATYATSAGIATYATNAGIATSVIGGIASVTSLNVSGISTLGILTVGNVYSTGIITATQFVGSFSGNVTTATYATNAGVATYATSAGIATYATNAGVATYATNAGVATYATNAGIATYATSAGIATYATNAGISTNLKGGVAGNVPYQSASDTTNFVNNGIAGQVLLFSGSIPYWGNASAASGAFSGITIRDEGTIVGSAASISSINFVGNNIVATASGAGATITLSNDAQYLTGTAPGSVISQSNGFTVTGNLFVSGNVSIGGSSVILDAGTLNIRDKDIVLGITTNALNQDVSTDNTANHGGIAIASTEGSPLIDINGGVGTDSIPYTYKQIMWLKSGSWPGLSTDAWLFNYGVGIGSTQLPSGTRLAVGSVKFTENDLSVVRNINASGVITATQFVGSFTGNATSATYATSAGIATYATNAGIATYAPSAGISTYATSSGIATYATNVGIATNIKGGVAGNVPYQSATDATSFVTNGTAGQVLLFNGSVPYWGSASAASGSFSGITIRDEGSTVGTASSVTSINFVGSNIVATASGAGATITIADNLVGTALSISGISTFTNGPVLIGTATSTGTASQPLQVTGSAYVSGNLGIGTTNPSTTLQVNGTTQIQSSVGNNNLLTWYNTYDSKSVSFPRVSLLVSPETAYGSAGGGINISASPVVFSHANRTNDGGSSLQSFTNITNLTASTAISSVIGIGFRNLVYRNSTIDLGSAAGSNMTGIVNTVTQGTNVDQSVRTDNAYGTQNTITFSKAGATNIFTEYNSINIADTANFSASVTNAYGSYNVMQVGAASGTGIGTLTNYYGNYVLPTVALTGRLTNYYGLYLATPIVSGIITNRYSIYSSDTSSPMYHAGSIGIGTTNPTQSLHVQGNARITGAVYDSSNSAGTSGQVLQSTASGTQWINVSAASGAFSGISVLDEGSIVGSALSVSSLNFVGSNIVATASGVGATITISSNLVGTALSISGISTLGTVQISSGIVTATTGVVTYYGDGSKLTGISGGISSVSISTNTTNQVQYLTYATGTGNTTGLGVSLTGLVFNPSTTRLGIGTTNPTSALTITGGDINLNDGGTYSTAFLTITPTANRFISLPDATGTVALVAGSSGQVTYNSAGIQSGSSAFTFDGSNVAITGRLNVSGITTTATLNVGTGGTIITTTSAGLVGIGTTNPSQTLHVQGNVRITGGLYDSNNNVGTAGSVLSSTGSGLSWIAAGSGGGISSISISTNTTNQSQYLTYAIGTGNTTGLGVSTTGLVFNPSSNNLGIGVTAPAFKADIGGDARVTSTNKMRFGGTAGTTNFYIQYNSTTNSLDFVAG